MGQMPSGRKVPTRLRTDHGRVCLALGDRHPPVHSWGQEQRGLERGQEPHSVPTWPVTQIPASPTTTTVQLQTESPCAHCPRWLRGHRDHSRGRKVPGSASGPASTQRAEGFPPHGTPAAPASAADLPGKEHTSAPPIWKALRPNGSISSAIITNPSGNVSSKMKSLCQNFH